MEIMVNIDEISWQLVPQQWFIYMDIFQIKNGRSHDLISGRLEESEVGVGGLHFGWIFLNVYCN